MEEKDIKGLSAKFETEVRKIIEEESSKNLSTYDLEVAISQRISKLQSELLATVLNDREREAGKKKPVLNANMDSFLRIIAKEKS